MFSDRTRQRLIDIADNIAAIEDYVRGMTFDMFRADRKTVDAVERCLQRVTEAVIQIGPDEMQQVAPEVPSVEIRNMGNVLRHEYHRIDHAILFAAITDDLPVLKDAVALVLGKR